MSENTLNLSDPRGPQGDRRQTSALSFLGNGKGTWLRWLLGLLGAAAVSYITASAQIDRRVSVLEERQANQNAEVLRKLDEQSRAIESLRVVLMERR